jgi:hypothetical protein
MFETDTYSKLAGRTCVDTDEMKQRVINPGIIEAIFVQLQINILAARNLDVLKREIAYGQEHCRKATGLMPPDDIAIAADALGDDETVEFLHAALGMLTEAGEFAEIVFGAIFKSAGIDYVHVVEELGDQEWYMAIPRRVLDIHDSQVKSLNIRKLLARFPNKFSQDGALIRNLEKEREVLEGRG